MNRFAATPYAPWYFASVAAFMIPTGIQSVMLSYPRNVSAIEAVAGKGEKVKAVNSGGVFPVLEYLGN